MEKIDFKKLIAQSKAHEVTPVVELVKALADASVAQGLNKKLTEDKRGLRVLPQVDVGVAVDDAGQLRVAVVRDVTNKTLAEVKADIVMFANKGAKLSPADQNLENVCWVVSSMGKNATDLVIPVLPKGCAGIVGVGRTDASGQSMLAASLCHATLTGVQGASLMRDFTGRLGQ